MEESTMRLRLSKPSVRASLTRSVYLALLRMLCICSLVAGADQKSKQVVPAQGNKSDQSISIDHPYCDAYLPYSYTVVNGEPQITTILSGPSAADSFVSQFLDRGQSTNDAISKDRPWADPGYPLLGNPKNKLLSNGNDLTRLIDRLFSTDSSGNPATVPLCGPSSPSKSEKPDIATQYYLVHIVRWKRVKGAYQTDSSDWYVFNQSDSKAAHREFPFTFHPLVSGDLRIFGSNKVFFLAVHLAPMQSPATGSNLPGPSDYLNFHQAVELSYKLKVSKVEPVNIQDLKAFLGVLTGAGGAPAAAALPNKNLQEYRTKLLNTLGTRPYDGLYGAAQLTNLESLPVQITTTMTATLPKTDPQLPDQVIHEESGFWDSINPSTQNKATPAAGTPQSGCPTSGSQGICPENTVTQNEGLYWWDVSIGIPFKGISQVQYDTSGTGQITPRNISKSSAYGFFVLAPWKEDIVSPPSLGIPHILMGLPLSGKVLDSPFVGLGETFNLSKLPSVGPKLSKVVPFGIRFYAGLVENKQFGVAPPTGGSAPYHWVGHLQYGIEFSVKDIANKLTSNGKSTKASTTSK
jgi:hypothetical protein